jgi:YegS/Rv2252/BmrU family lipid kinase
LWQRELNHAIVDLSRSLAACLLFYKDNTQSLIKIDTAYSPGAPILMSTRVTLIMNPAANRGDALRLKEPLTSQVEKTASKGDFVLSWAYTTRPQHAADLARDAAEAGEDIVVAVGGDGTVHEVVNGLMQANTSKRPSLGIIPVGSGNDFAFNMGLPSKAPEAVRVIFTGKPRTIDVGMIADTNGRVESWNNSCGVGFSGTVNYWSRNITILRGFILYFVAVLRTIIFQPPNVNVEMNVDENEVVKERITMLSVCNGPREGGGFPVSPNAVMDDGLLTYTVMGDMNRFQILRFLPVVMAANHLKHPRFFRDGTATRYRVKADAPLDIHIDGEIFAQISQNISEVEFTVVPGALQVIS